MMQAMRLPTVKESGRRRVGSYLGGQVLWNFDLRRFELWNKAEGSPDRALRSGSGFLTFIQVMPEETVREQGWAIPLEGG